MAKELRLHPIMVLTSLKPFLFLLIIPLVQKAYILIRYNRISRNLSFEIILFLLIMLCSVLNYKACSLKLYDNRFELLKGIVFKQKEIALFKNIAVLNIKKGFFGISRVTVKTVGQKRKKFFSFYLYSPDIETLLSEYFKGDEFSSKRYSFKEKLKTSLLSSSSFAGLVAFVPIAVKLRKYLDIKLLGVVDTVNPDKIFLLKIFPPIINVVTFLVVLGFFVSFIIRLFNLKNYTMLSNGDYYIIKNGFIIAKTQIINKKAITLSYFKQTPLLIPFKLFSKKYCFKSRADTLIFFPLIKDIKIKAPKGGIGIKSVKRLSVYLCNPESEDISVLKLRSFKKHKDRYTVIFFLKSKELRKLRVRLADKETIKKIIEKIV